MRNAVATIAIALTFAAFGCSTNNNPGNGQPANQPGVVPASTPGASSGMASSFTTPMTRSERAAAAVDAIAVLAADQGYRGRVLGKADPAPKPATTPNGVAAPASVVAGGGIVAAATTSVGTGTTAAATSASVPTQTAIAPRVGAVASPAQSANSTMSATAPVVPAGVAGSTPAVRLVTNPSGSVTVTNTTTKNP